MPKTGATSSSSDSGEGRKVGAEPAGRERVSTLTRVPALDPHPAHRLTQAQAAGLLGVSTARVAELVGEGRLTPVAKYAKAGLLRHDRGAAVA